MHGDMEMVKTRGLTGARNILNPDYSILEMLPCFFKESKIMRERKTKQESNRAGERNEEQ